MRSAWVRPVRARRSLGVPAEQMLYARAALLAPAATRQHVLETFCTWGTHGVPTPGVDRGADSGADNDSDDMSPAALAVKAHASARRIAAWLGARHDLHALGTCEAQLVACQGAFLLNAHDVSSAVGGRYCAALFADGARLAHACVAPNTVYHVADAAAGAINQNGEAPAFERKREKSMDLPLCGAATGLLGCHRALRGIAVGEMLTSDYLGPAAVCCVRLRRRTLAESKLFVCGCAACGPGSRDSMRALPCPACGPRRAAAAEGLLSEAAVWDAVNERWLPDTASERRCITPANTSEGTAGAADDDAAVDADAWHCEACGTMFTAAQLDAITVRGQGLLSLERGLENSVHPLTNDVEDEPPGPKRDDMYARGRSLLPTVTRALGGRHWASMALRAMQLEEWLVVAAAADTDEGGSVRFRAELLAGLAAIGHDYSLAGAEAFCQDVWHEFVCLRDWFRARGFLAVELGRAGDILDLLTLLGAGAARRCDGAVRVFREILDGVRVEYGADSSVVSSFAADVHNLERLLR